MSIGFTWDRRKAESNRRKHRITFEEAATAFGDPVARIQDNPAHSQGEIREVIVGTTASGKLVLVSFTERDGMIRIISARRATAHERRDYEETTS